MEKIKVIIWGFGAMGSGMADMLLDKDGVEITGICDTHPDRRNRPFMEILGRRDKSDSLVIEPDIKNLIKPGCADVVLLATDSFTAKAFDKIMFLLENKLNVITTAEEMAWPEASEPELTKKMDETARENGVSVLGTGINPGLIMDLLVIMMTGACRDVKQIRAERINSLSPFGPAVMEEQGVGFSPEAFDEGVRSRKLAGHVGFNESIGMICRALGWTLDKPVIQSMEAIISHVHRKTPYAEVEAGQVAGCRQEGYGWINGEQKIEMIHPQQVEPQAEGIDTGDYIQIKGIPDISLSITPEVPGGIGTIAMCVNMIPQIINASPGLKTMLDLPVPRAIMGDMRDRLDRR